MQGVVAVFEQEGGDVGLEQLGRAALTDRVGRGGGAEVRRESDLEGEGGEGLAADEGVAEDLEEGGRVSLGAGLAGSGPGERLTVGR